MRYIGLFFGLVFFSLFSNAQNKNIGTDNVRKVYITPTGIYKETNSNKTTSIYISQKTFKGYQYITVKANKEHGTRVHILKKEPKNHNELVQYSDYYKENILVRKGIKLDIVIPQDAKCIYIINHADNNYKPDIVTLYTAESLSNSEISEKKNLSQRAASSNSQKFMHWNIGNFSKGEYPYSKIKEGNYKVRLDGFINFINKYCPDCHYLLNECNDIFAKVNGSSVSTASVLFNKRQGYKIFPRSTSSGYNRLAIFWKEGLINYKYGIFESLKGVKNKNGTLEYGAGYCISQYAVGSTTLYVMNLHAPNMIKAEESNALYKEILNICSKYDNFIIVGDLNRTSSDKFSVFTNAGFKILNDKSVTYPSKRILDWVLYRCKDVTLSNFRVYKEAVDSNGELLSDHLPLSFTVTSK
jgi:hypothetical protein